MTRATADFRSAIAAAFLAGLFLLGAIWAVAAGLDGVLVFWLGAALVVCVLALVVLRPPRRRPYEATHLYARRILAAHGLTCEVRQGSSWLQLDGRMVEIYACDEGEAAAELLRAEQMQFRSTLAPWTAGGPH